MERATDTPKARAGQQPALAKSSITFSPWPAARYRRGMASSAASVTDPFSWSGVDAYRDAPRPGKAKYRFGLEFAFALQHCPLARPGAAGQAGGSARSIWQQERALIRRLAVRSREACHVMPQHYGRRCFARPTGWTETRGRRRWQRGAPALVLRSGAALACDNNSGDPDRRDLGPR